MDFYLTIIKLALFTWNLHVTLYNYFFGVYKGPYNTAFFWCARALLPMGASKKGLLMSSKVFYVPKPTLSNMLLNTLRIKCSNL